MVIIVKNKMLLVWVTVLVFSLLVAGLVFARINSTGYGLVVGEIRESQALGEGKTEFLFNVVDVNGKTTEFLVKTDKKTVGEALSEQGLILGEDGIYGLYVKVVNGIRLEYEKDGKYWAFYINDEYATSGVDKTEIVEGNIYSFKAE